MITSRFGGLRRLAPIVWTLALTLGTLALTLGASASAQDLDKTIKLVMDKNRAAARAQQLIDRADDTTDRLLNTYRDIQRQLDSLQVYDTQVSKLVVAQRKQIADLERRIADAAMVSREVTPLMFRMLESLETFIGLDVPFLMEERKARLQELRAMMDRSDVPDSEKFRRILEAYQVENEYGRTIEAYRGKAGTDSDVRTVDFLRIGRVILIYKTLDGREARIWNQETSSWEVLPDRYHSSIQKGFRIARKQMAPDLVRLPVPAAKEAR